jgi:hypothetical protein
MTRRPRSMTYAATSIDPEKMRPVDVRQKYGPRPSTPTDAPASTPTKSASSTPAQRSAKMGDKQKKKKKTVAETRTAVRDVILLMEDGRTEGEAVREVSGQYHYAKWETLARAYRRLHRIVRREIKREQMLSASKETASEKLSAGNALATPRLSARTKKSDPGRTEKD